MCALLPVPPFHPGKQHGGPWAVKAFHLFRLHCSLIMYISPFTVKQQQPAFKEPSATAGTTFLRKALQLPFSNCSGVKENEFKGKLPLACLLILHLPTHHSQ